MVACGVVASFASDFWMLCAMRLLLGIFTAGARNAGFVYGALFIILVTSTTMSLMFIADYIYILKQAMARAFEIFKLRER